MNLNRVADYVTEVQKAAGDIHLNPGKYVPNIGIISKGDKDYTTAVDIAVEKFQRARLKKAFPDIGFLGEETDNEGEQRFRWIVDPTDGTAVYATGGEYYSNSIALADREAGRVLFGSVWQPSKRRQFLRVNGEVLVREEILGREGKKLQIERVPVPSQSRGLPELMGCSYGTSKYHNRVPGIKEALAGVFDDVEFPELGRNYHLIDSRPASGSSALFLGDIADGNRHFALLYFQKAWDLAVGALFARDAGCAVQCGDAIDKITCGDLETQIARCSKEDLINVAIFANPNVKDIVMERFQLARAQQ